MGTEANTKDGLTDAEPEVIRTGRGPRGGKTAAERKREQRLREKNQKIEATLKEKGSLRNREWWALQFGTLSVKQREEMDKREMEVGELAVLIDSFMAYVPEDEEDAEILRELISNVQRDVKQHGLSDWNVMGIPELCKCHTQVRYGDAEATRDAIMYGKMTALDSQTYWNFYRKYIADSTERCQTPGCENPQVRGAVTNKGFCITCAATRNRLARETAARLAASQITGRVTDQDAIYGEAGVFRG